MRFVYLALMFVLPTSSFAFEGEWQLAVPKFEELFTMLPGLSTSPLLTVTTDRDSAVYSLQLLRDATGAPVGAFVQKNDDSADGTPYLLPAISRPSGVVIFASQGRNVLIMQGTYDRTQAGGTFQMRYLTNGLFMSYRSCNVQLRSQGQNYWLQNAYTGVRVTTTKVLTTKLGVSTLEGICP
jgi:hypothetical protein